MELTNVELNQVMSLDGKVEATKAIIKEWAEHFGENKCYVSFSGGKSSVVLLHIVRELYPNTEAVFIDTGIEYPEVVQFVKTFDNLNIIKPKMTFDKIVQEHGWPVVNTEISQRVWEARNGAQSALDSMHGCRKDKNGNIVARYNYSSWEFLLDAPFKICHKCCVILKKKPLLDYYRKTKKVPIVGTLASSSRLRGQSYMRNGCNSYESKVPKSAPLSFWNEQDVMNYIKSNNIKVCPLHGFITTVQGQLVFSNFNRTSCMFCGYGVHTEKCPNRFQRLKKVHPEQWDYIINQLGMSKVLDYIGVSYKNKKGLLGGI